MRLTKDQKAITLIALVITIIVLLILAGVALATLTGNTSIIDNANYAVERYNASAGNDQNVLNQVENLFAKYMGGSSSAGDDDDTPTQKTAASLQEGDWVMYDTEVSGIGVIPCRVLYNDFTHGIQIISSGKVADVALGGNDFNTALETYNDAIEILNGTKQQNGVIVGAMKYLNITYAYDARCVGSAPAVVNGMFTLKNSETAGPVELSFNYNDSTSFNAKSTDTNCETDWNKMRSLGIARGNDNVATERSYWLASRFYYDGFDNGQAAFDVRAVNVWGNDFDAWIICELGEDGPIDEGRIETNGLRPCFSLKSTVKVITEGGKDGTNEAKAYTLAP